MTKWWSNRSDPERFDLYTRWSLYALFAVVPLGVLALSSDGGAGSGTMLGLVLLSVIQAAISVIVLSKSITHCLGGAPPAASLVAALAVLSGVGVAACLTVPGVSFGADSDAGIWLPYLFAIVGISAISPLLSNRHLLLGSAAIAASVGAIGWAEDADPTRTVAAALGIGISAISVTLAFRLSVRMLKTVWEIERSRTVQAALAVAEERLRFSRDLHDVLGRNLSVIAVKSELASELVRRGRPEAASEIAEVNRIAQESLREVRAVVRGYREADFATELAGARGILAAAGIGCRVDGDPTLLPADIQKTLGWVVREATTNVLRHSRARTCTIEVSQTGGRAVLTVDNDGAVADGPTAGGPGSVAPREHLGSGLSGLQERLVALGGRLTAGPLSHNGFRLRAEIPLQVRTGVSGASANPAGAPAQAQSVTAEQG